MSRAASPFAVARSSYVERQLLARRALLATRKAWRQIDPKEIRYSWRFFVGPTVLSIVSGAQHDAAAAADATVSAGLTAQGVSSASVGPINAAAFAGVASDGRDLAFLLELSNLYALRQIGAGQTPAQALSFGGRWLEMVVATQVVDAGRVAQQAATVAREHVTGYYRVLSPPSCSRCVVLAGRWYRWDAGFERHPRCDCTEIPAQDGALDDHPELITPEAYFGSLRASEKARVFGVDGAKAIQDGADIGQVVNARDGMFAAGGRDLTRVGAKTYGQGGARLMPEQIYREAHGSRTEAIRLLQRFGYIR